jgi:flagellar biosynthesis/type III secretory pathway protein FliH
MLPDLGRRGAAGEPVAPAETAARGYPAVSEGHRIARAIVARATAEAHEIREGAREQGFEAGRAEAVAREGRALADAAAALLDAARHLAAARTEAQRALELALPRLAVAAASRLLRRELTAVPETLAQIVRDALAMVTPAARVAIRLHPDDVGTLERHRSLLDEVLGGAELRLEASPEVAPGGCFVETEALTLAAGVPEQLERALALLTGDSA